MAKSKSKISLGKIVACVAAVLGLAAIIMLFVPQLSYKSVTGLDKGDSLNGLKITFGYKEKDVAILNFSVGNFLTYVLALVGVVFAVLAVFGKLGKIAPIVSAAAFIVSGVFFFCAHTFMMVNVGKLTGDAAAAVSDTFKGLYTLGAGAIVGGILSLLAGLAMAAKLFIKK
ncbi:MAG: hypothetical protein HDP34_02570 [Clostridia bacterium]|nr:hypothetical protein [Clostridia bacterium]